MNRVIDTYGFANEHTHYDRDLAGNVWQMIDAKTAVYHFGYDGMNRKTSATYPTDATSANRTETWSYTTGGVLDSHKNPADQHQHFHYDNRNRPDHSWWDGNVGPDIVTSYDFASRVTSVVTNGGETTVAFGYDAANRQTSEDQGYRGFPSHHLAIEVDDDGMRKHFTADGFYELRYDFTARNQLQHINDSAGNVWFAYSYDAAGNMTKRLDLMYGVNDSAHAISWDGVNQYDALNRLCMWENTGGNEYPLTRSWYQYDSLGRETATVRDEQSGKGERYGYNAMNQLTSVSYNADQVWNGNPQNATRTVTYNVDALNRQSVNENGTVTGYIPNGLNQYQSSNGTTYNYDPNFNLREGPNWWGVFDANSRLTEAGGGGNIVDFTYDGLGRCVKRMVNGVAKYFVYDGWKPIIELEGESQTMLANNIYGARPDEILWRYQVGVGHLRYHHDIHGNVTYLLGPWGEGLEKYTYDAFGTPTITDWSGNVRSQSAYGNRFMFQGREYLSELGIYDFRNRYYNPNLGRFLQKDPLGFGGGDANLFRYCGGDPVNRSDPYGLVPPAKTDTKTYNTEDLNSIPSTGEIIVRGSPIETAVTAGLGPTGPISVLDTVGATVGEGSKGDGGNGGDVQQVQNRQPRAPRGAPRGRNNRSNTPVWRPGNPDVPTQPWEIEPYEPPHDVDQLDGDIAAKSLEDIFNLLFGWLGDIFQGLPPYTSSPQPTPSIPYAPQPSPSGPPTPSPKGGGG